MTQVNGAQDPGRKVASTPRARVRTVAAHRADFEGQVRSWLSNNAAMALTEPEHVRARMKELRARAGNPSQYEVAHDLDVPPRTFQSWENAEVETDRANYEKVARYYSRKLKEKVSANWILFGQDERPALPTPDLLGQVNGNGTIDDLRAQLDRIEQKLDKIAEALTDQYGHPLAQAVTDLQDVIQSVEPRVAILELDHESERESQASPTAARSSGQGRNRRRRAGG